MSEWYTKTWYAVRDGWKLHSINWDREGETVEEVWVKDDTTNSDEVWVSSTSYTRIVDKNPKDDKDKNPKDPENPTKKAKTSKSLATKKSSQDS